MPEMNSVVRETLTLTAGTLLTLALGRLIIHQAGKFSSLQPEDEDTQKTSEVRFPLLPLVIALLGVLLVLLGPIFPLYIILPKNWARFPVSLRWICWLSR